MSKTITKLINVLIAWIILDESVQPRFNTDQETIDGYAALMKEGHVMPRISVFLDPSHEPLDGIFRYILADGWHRILAAIKLGWTHIDVEVYSGTLSDARLFAFRANAEAGLKLKKREKSANVKKMLRHPEWSEWSDPEIAKHCGCSHTTVRTIRNSMLPDLSDITETCKLSGRSEQTSHTTVENDTINPPQPFTTTVPTQSDVVAERSDKALERNDRVRLLNDQTDPMIQRGHLGTLYLCGYRNGAQVVVVQWDGLGGQHEHPSAAVELAPVLIEPAPSPTPDVQEADPWEGWRGRYGHYVMLRVRLASVLPIGSVGVIVGFDGDRIDLEFPRTAQQGIVTFKRSDIEYIGKRRPRREKTQPSTNQATTAATETTTAPGVETTVDDQAAEVDDCDGGTTAPVETVEDNDGDGSEVEVTEDDCDDCDDGGCDCDGEHCDGDEEYDTLIESGMLVHLWADAADASEGADGDLVMVPRASDADPDRLVVGVWVVEHINTATMTAKLNSADVGESKAPLHQLVRHESFDYDGARDIEPGGSVCLWQDNGVFDPKAWDVVEVNVATGWATIARAEGGEKEYHPSRLVPAHEQGLRYPESLGTLQRAIDALTACVQEAVNQAALWPEDGGVNPYRIKRTVLLEARALIEATQQGLEEEEQGFREEER